MVQIVNSVQPKINHHIEFIYYFKKVKEPRRIRKTIYPFDEILLLVLGAVLYGADDWVAISLFG